MKVLGLAGPAGSGKDSIADYLAERYGFVKFSFSDALYREVVEAFSLPGDSLLRDRNTKDTPTERLALVDCLDDEFIGVAVQHIPHGSHHLHELPLSPRQVLQLWGTQYRRAQDPSYWITRAHDWLLRLQRLAPYPELCVERFVNTSVRFPDEQDWVHRFSGGNVWHVRSDRPGMIAVNPHESEADLPVLEGEREIFNNHTLEYLYMGVDQLMSSNIPSIRIEPPLPMEKPGE